MAKAKKHPLPNSETPSGYFRRVFKEDPQLLRSTSSQPLLDRYPQDHPDESEVPKRVVQILYNVKSVLRSRKRRRKAQASPETPAANDRSQPASRMTSAPVGGTGHPDLEQLEERIDDCLALAKGLDRTGLDEVISHLRRARNGVVRRQDW